MGPDGAVSFTLEFSESLFSVVTAQIDQLDRRALLRSGNLEYPLPACSRDFLVDTLFGLDITSCVGGVA